MEDTSSSCPSKVIFFIHVQRLIDKDSLCYLALITDTSIEPLPMESISIVQEFADVFFTDLLSVLFNRNIDFAIGSTKFIFIFE